MIYAASTITGPVAFGRVCIHILCLCLPFMFYLMESVRKLVTWQKVAFSGLRSSSFPEFWAGAVSALLPRGCSTASQELSEYWSFLLAPPERKESLQPCCWQPVSCRSCLGRARNPQTRQERGLLVLSERCWLFWAKLNCVPIKSEFTWCHMWHALHFRLIQTSTSLSQDEINSSPHIVSLLMWNQT